MKAAAANYEKETTMSRLFAIDTDNAITAFPAAEQIPEGQEHFASEKELAKLATAWPGDRLAQIWNSFAGVAGLGSDLTPVKKFKDRKSGVARIWKAIQKLDAPDAPQAADVAPDAAAGTTDASTKKGAAKARKSAKEAKPAKPAKAAKTAAEPRADSKKAIILALLQRAKGATMAQIAQATDWQNHSIRGFISGNLTKKMGLAVESTKNEAGERTYRIAK